MRKNRRYILVIAILVLLFGTSYYSMNKQQKAQENQKDTTLTATDNKEQGAALTKAELDKIPRIIKSYTLNFDKTTTSFTSEPVDVFKDKTEKKMLLIFDDKVNSNISAKIYQDDTIINEIKSVETNHFYIIPYEMNNDKSTFKIEINYLAPLGDNEKLTAKVGWYPNRSS